MTIDLFPVIFFSSLIALLNPKSTIAFRNNKNMSKFYKKMQQNKLVLTG